MKKLDLNFKEVLESSLEYGVPLPKKVRTSIRRKLEFLQEALPVHSNIELRYLNKGGRFRGSLNIRTLHQNFSASAFGYDPLIVFENLKRDIEEQLLTWKRNRFITSSNITNNGFCNNSTNLLGGR